MSISTRSFILQFKIDRKDLQTLETCVDSSSESEVDYEKSFDPNMEIEADNQNFLLDPRENSNPPNYR